MTLAVVTRPWTIEVKPYAIVVEVAPGVVEVVAQPDVVHVAYVAAQGPRGADGAIDDHVHDQAVAAASWTINHNLGRKPNVEVRNLAGTVILAEVTHVSSNQARIDFAAAQAGSARLV